MDIKKVTYDEALARFKHSLEIKRAAENVLLKNGLVEDLKVLSSRYDTAFP